MEAERPRGYIELLSGHQSWTASGICVQWASHQTPGASKHKLMEPLTAQISVKCQPQISPSDVTVSVWTNLVHQGNDTGIYREIQMTYVDDSKHWLGNDIVYTFQTSVCPSERGSFRLTYLVKLNHHLVWANVFREDHIVSVAGSAALGNNLVSAAGSATVGDTVIKSSWQNTMQTEGRSSVSDDMRMVQALAVQRSANVSGYVTDLDLATSATEPSCRETVEQISSLDHIVLTLSAEFDARSVHLVNKLNASESSNKKPGDCLQYIRSSWQRVFTSMQCAEVHVRNAALYHEFFQNLKYTQSLLNTALGEIYLYQNQNKNDVGFEWVINQIKQVIAEYQKWQTQLIQLFEQAKQVVPLPERLNQVKEARPVTSLADVTTGDFRCIQGETLMLMDNSDEKLWNVQSSTGLAGKVPPVMLLIPPPFKLALESVVQLKLQLLAMWTNSVKRVGFQIIACMNYVLQDWTEEEVNLFQSIPMSYKTQLVCVLREIESKLANVWNGYGDFEELKERKDRLIMILEMDDSSQKFDFPSQRIDEFLTTTVTRVLKFEDLLNIYLEMWSQWEAFFNLMEMLKNPNFMLYCEKWDQLRYMKSAKFIKFWESSVDFVKEDITRSKASFVLNQVPSEMEKPKLKSNVDVIIEDKTEEFITDTVTSIMEKELQTYIIKSVIDPTDGKTQISLQKAIMLGIIDQVERTYVNPMTGVGISFSDAINKGLILIEILKREKIEEEKKSYGMITIKTTSESHPYHITGVLDPVTRLKLTVTDAIKRKVFDVESYTYRTDTGQLVGLAEAVKSGLLLTDETDVKDGQQVAGSQEVEETAYLVHAVVDQKKRDKVSFTAAIRDGLLDKETGEYVNNVTGERTPVLQAIMRGFIKAKHVTDTHKLDINPENAILVEKMQHAKHKLMAELKVIKAFKTFEK